MEQCAEYLGPLPHHVLGRFAEECSPVGSRLLPSCQCYVIGLAVLVDLMLKCQGSLPVVLTYVLVGDVVVVGGVSFGERFRSRCMPFDDYQATRLVDKLQLKSLRIMRL